nr:hypothetical protein [uncultured Dysosmobacter sp.]
MTTVEVTEHQRDIIKRQAAVIADLVVLLEQSDLAGPGVEATLAQARDLMEVDHE